MSCVPLRQLQQLQNSNATASDDPRHFLERKATEEAGIETIPFRDLSGHFFDLKLGGLFFSHHTNPRARDDCTHLLPVAATTAYRVLWLHTLRAALRGPKALEAKRYEPKHISTSLMSEILSNEIEMISTTHPY